MAQPSIAGTGHGIPRMGFGSDGSNHYEMAVDSDGHPQVDVQTYPGSNALGNKPFGYYDHYLETVDSISGNGTTNVNASVVPAGEVWVVTHISIWHNDPLARVLRIALFSGGTAHRLVDVGQISQAYLLERQGWWVLKAGDRLQGTAEALAAGRTVRLCGNGFKMKVA